MPRRAQAGCACTEGRRHATGDGRRTTDDGQHTPGGSAPYRRSESVPCTVPNRRPLLLLSLLFPLSYSALPPLSFLFPLSFSFSFALSLFSLPLLSPFPVHKYHSTKPLHVHESIPNRIDSQTTSWRLRRELGPAASARAIGAPPAAPMAGTKVDRILGPCRARAASEGALLEARQIRHAHSPAGVGLWLNSCALNCSRCERGPKKK